MRPLIVKAKFLLPGPSRHEAARDYLRYIANPSRDDLARWEETLRQRDVESEASIYAMHIQERKGSEGLFGPDVNGEVSEAELEQAFGDHAGPIWTMIVSVHHDDAVAELPDLMGRAAWEDALRLTMPQVGATMHIPAQDLRWVAAMHRRPKDGSPHVHILFWSQDPTKGVRNVHGRTYAQVGPKALDALKRMWTSELYGPVRERLGKEKSGLRAEAGETAWQVLGRSQAEDLGSRLAEIAANLPGHGRLAYAYMPPAVRVQVDQVLDWLLEQPDLKPIAKRYGDIAAEMATHYSMDPERHEKARQNAVADLRHRLAGGVLRQAAGFDQGLAWRAVTDDIWAAVRGHGEADGSLQAAIQQAVNSVSTGRMTPGQAARALLAAPELSAHMTTLRTAVARRGDPATLDERQARLVRRLAGVLEGRIERSARYVRRSRGYWAATAVAVWSAAIAAQARQAEREAAIQGARMAAQIEAEQEAVANEMDGVDVTKEYPFA